jgi:RecJ-like exonuclease
MDNGNDVKLEAGWLKRSLSATSASFHAETRSHRTLVAASRGITVEEFDAQSLDPLPKEWIACPECNGKGIVEKKHYHRICRNCLGKGDILPPKQPEQMEMNLK